MKNQILALVFITTAVHAAERETFEATKTVVKERTVTKVVSADSRTTAKTVLNKNAKELAIPSGSKVVRMNVGESKLVFTGRKGLFKPAPAFFLPPESTAIAQLVIEISGRDTNYFIKARAPGVGIGGEVKREWLDATGYRARNEADQARIQQAIKASPLYIDIR